MQALAVVMKEPGFLALEPLELSGPAPADAVVDIAWSGISAGTERLLWEGRMPVFPGMGYPLVPGYESVGTVVSAGPDAGVAAGERVFVPGANCYTGARGLFGGAAQRVVVPGAKVLPIASLPHEQATLLALAATAHHIAPLSSQHMPDLIVGHGVLGRLLARLVVLAGASPVVWERNPARRDGAIGYEVRDPDADPRRDYKLIADVSGDASLLDTLVMRLAPNGEIILGGFYSTPISFAFPPAFMREARLRVAAQWSRDDLVAVRDLVVAGRLSLDGLITHRVPADTAERAYPQAFDDPRCLKMILDWRHLS
jgi:bacteriochlorophyllide a dehydrogenase